MTNRKYIAAASLLFLSAALHVPVLLLAFSSMAASMIVGIVLWTALGFALLREARYAAWLAFFGMLVGLIIALANALALFGLLSTLFWAIFVVDLVAALVLFGVLWAPRQVASAAG